MKYLLALDQGTTSSRAIIFTTNGEVVAKAQQEFQQFFPQPGWVEHDPEEIWASQESTILRVLDEARLTPGDMLAVGITNQRETTVIWDRETGRAIAPAIVWQDRRTAGYCEELAKEGLGPMLQEKTGLVVDAYFSASKLRWLLDHIPGARDRASRGELAFGTIDTWLTWKLTEGRIHTTDTSNASRTLLFNLQTGTWDRELLELFGIPELLLPRIVDTSGVIAQASVAIPGVPIGSLVGDQQAALFGQACLQPGMVKNTYGTGCFMLMQTGTERMRSKNRLLSTVAWRLDGRTEFALEGSVFVAGAVVQYLRDGLGIIRDSSEVEALAKTVPDSGGVYFVPAFVGLGAPHWDPLARGAILGLTRGASAAHIARAALEAIAFQVADVLKAMEADTGIQLKDLRVDGGAANNDLLMQLQTDLLGCPVRRPRVTETTALGAALLAGRAVGVFKNLSDVAACWIESRRFQPSDERDAFVSRYAGWHRAVDRVRGWEMG